MATPSFSSSSSSSSSQPKHDVFLSFRGEDTRRGFTGNLHYDLKRKGIGAYMDEHQLRKGDELSSELLKAIEESIISIIIFSKNYASSSWCLRELTKIMELKRANKQVVLPIFYHVPPSDVRKCNGSFGSAFADHLQNWPEQLPAWKQAFVEAGDFKGWHIVGDIYDRDEAEYREEIVGRVIEELNRMYPSDHSNELVGIDHQIEQIKLMLRIGSDEGIRIIGIWGMGGIGKTTLAQALYAQFSNLSSFESCCFLANVREEIEKSSEGIHLLQTKLLSEILEEENPLLSPPKIGSQFIRRLRRKRVFLILDDVSDVEQLRSLAISDDTFGSGSRIIVTSRDLQVLRHGVLDPNRIYEVKKLNADGSLRLFSLHAFKQDQPPHDFGDLSSRVLEYAEGVPIALMVLGCALYQKTRDYWESAVKRLKEDPDPKILNLLKISFDGLSGRERSIFLDVACFFKGCNIDNVTKILDTCYGGSAHCGISNLVDKCLLTVHSHTLSMHDLLQEMGWSIVRQEAKEPGKRTRLWDPKDICHVLKHNTGTKSVEGIFLDISQVDEIELHPNVFERMCNLKFIKFYYPPNFQQEHKTPMLLLQEELNSLNIGLSLLCLRFPRGRSRGRGGDQLRYFDWEDCPLKSFPSYFSPRNLVELILPNSNIEHLWKGKQSRCQAAERGKERLTILKLENLRVMDVQGCKNLTKIPDLSKAKKIEEFLVRGCQSLVELPSMTHLSCLKGELDLSNCAKLKRFPKLPLHLNSLNLSGTAIEEVPSSIGHLSQLTSLIMKGTKIQSLPPTIVMLNVLHLIDLSHCSELTNLPNLPLGIKTLNMSGTKIPSLPSFILNLGSLELIVLSHCQNITNFPNLPKSIKALHLSNTPIKQVPSIHSLESLTLLSMRNCTRLESLTPNICKFKSLLELDLNGCSSLKIAPSMQESLKSIGKVDLTGTIITNEPPPLVQRKREIYLNVAQVKKTDQCFRNEFGFHFFQGFGSTWIFIQYFLLGLFVFFLFLSALLSVFCLFWALSIFISRFCALTISPLFENNYEDVREMIQISNFRGRKMGQHYYYYI